MNPLLWLVKLLFGSNWQTTLYGYLTGLINIGILQGILPDGFNIADFFVILTSPGVLKNPKFWSLLAVLLPAILGRFARNGKPNPQLALNSK